MAKNVGIKHTVRLEFFSEKAYCLHFFGQKEVFLVKPTHVLLPITKEQKRVETNFSSDKRRKSTFSFGSFSVYIVIGHTVHFCGS